MAKAWHLMQRPQGKPTHDDVALKDLHKIIRQFRIKLHFLFCNRVNETQRLCMQGLSWHDFQTIFYK